MYYDTLSAAITTKFDFDSFSSHSYIYMRGVLAGGGQLAIILILMTASYSMCCLPCCLACCVSKEEVKGTIIISTCTLWQYIYTVAFH